MNDNFIDYNQMADDLFKWWEDDQKCKVNFTPWLDTGNMLGEFSDWLGTDEARDIILDKMLAFYKDVEDAEVAANKLFDYMQKGIDKYFEGESKKCVMN